jgi:hypothetical protein
MGDGPAASEVVRAWGEAVEAATVDLNRARDELLRGRRTLEATEQEAAETTARVALLQGRPSRAMMTWAGLIGLTAGACAFLVLLALLTLTHVLGGG